MWAILILIVVSLSTASVSSPFVLLSRYNFSDPVLSVQTQNPPMSGSACNTPNCATYADKRVAVIVRTSTNKILWLWFNCSVTSRDDSALQFVRATDLTPLVPPGHAPNQPLVFATDLSQHANPNVSCFESCVPLYSVDLHFVTFIVTLSESGTAYSFVHGEASVASGFEKWVFSSGRGVFAAQALNSSKVSLAFLGDRVITLANSREATTIDGE
jgi:hypothetical protein